VPELPEVETIRRQLEPDLVGRRFDRVEVLDHYFSKPSSASGFEETATGREVTDVGRRGKYLLIEFADGEAMVLHLRMTGNLVLVDPDGHTGPGDARIYRQDDGTRHLKARFHLDDGGELRFTDPRRFGRGFIAGPEELDAYFADRLGPEPLSEEFTAEALAAASEGRTAPLKSFLLDQKAVAGIGNIYADEALHRASLHPLSRGGPGEGSRPGWCLHRRLSRRPWRERPDAGGVPRPSPRGSALSTLWRCNNENRGGWPFDLFLWLLSEPFAASSSQEEGVIPVRANRHP
jgi:DNA-formamidopyrimidine glycosylase